MAVTWSNNWGCKGCKKRQIGCHSTCELYKKQKEKYEKERKEAVKMVRPTIYKSEFEFLACMHKARKY